MADTHKAFSDDIGETELARKKAELERLQAEVDEAAAESTDTEDTPAEPTGTAVIESWDNREIQFIRPSTATMVLFGYKMDRKGKDESDQIFTLLGFLERYMTADDFQELSEVWQDRRDVGLLIEMAQEIAFAMAEQSVEPDEEQMNRAMRRIEERQKRRAKAQALDAKGGHKAPSK